jgi:nucleotide-binding universal stress UspA family protein
MLLIGLERTTSGLNAFDARLSRVALSFGGPIAVMRVGGKQAKQPTQGKLNVLVPVTGTAVSRRGVEIALTLARASNAKCTALIVAGEARPSRKWRPLRQWTARHREIAILRDTIELADSLNAHIKTVTRVDEPPEDAILREVKRAGHDLIVIGVSRHPGEALFLGELASSILEHNEVSVLFLASESYGHTGASAAAAQLAP